MLCPPEELDAILLELMDKGIITEGDRQIALGIRPASKELMDSSMMMVNYAEGLAFSDLHGQESLRDSLTHYDNFLWKQMLRLR